jgi:hypothetical protein
MSMLRLKISKSVLKFGGPPKIPPIPDNSAHIDKGGIVGPTFPPILI